MSISHFERSVEVFSASTRNFLELSQLVNPCILVCFAVVEGTFMQYTRYVCARNN